MSRQIEQERIDSGKLTEDEILYLMQRDQLPKHIQPINPQLYKGTPVDATGHTGTVRTASTEELEAELERRRQLDAAADEGRGFQKSSVPGVHLPVAGGMHDHPTGGTPKPLRAEVIGETEGDEPEADFSNTSGQGGDEDEGYDGWTNNELRAEIASRNEGRPEDAKLPLTGKKDELIATLEADDAENEDEDEGE